MDIKGLTDGGGLDDNGVNPGQRPPLTLAYIGDAVFELLTRTWLLEQSAAPVNRLSKQARQYVNAEAQSRFYAMLEPILTEEEMSILKRGRNAKSHTTAKNAAVTDYRRATGLEALFGYLYLMGRTQRIMELFAVIRG